MSIETRLSGAARDIRLSVQDVAAVRRPRSVIPALAGVAALVLLIVGGLSMAGGTEPTGNDVGSFGDVNGAAFLDWSYETWDGGEGALDDFRGRPLVLNFWASWCPFCEAEMGDALQPVAADVGDQVAFLGFNLQDGRAAADRLVRLTGVEYDLGIDGGDFYRELGGVTMPFTVFFDGDGNVVRSIQGPIDRGSLESLLMELYDVGT